MPRITPPTTKKRPLQGAALTAHLTKTCPAPPAPKGNTRSLKHGVRRGDTKLAPVRQRHLEVLRQDYPDLDDRRMFILADRLARIDLATTWLDRQDKQLVKNRQGEVFALVHELEKWESRAEQVLAAAEKEARKPRRADLALDMAALEEGEAA